MHARINDIAAGHVGTPAQLTVVATHLLAALINHEYQHDQWIGEVRANDLGHPLPPDPDTSQVTRLDGYLVYNPPDEPGSDRDNPAATRALVAF